MQLYILVYSMNIHIYRPPNERLYRYNMYVRDRFYNLSLTSSASITPRQVASSCNTATTAGPFSSEPGDVARSRRTSPTALEGETQSHRSLCTEKHESRSGKSDTCVCCERDRIIRGGMISDSDKNTHDLASGCWMAVRSTSSRRSCCPG